MPKLQYCIYSGNQCCLKRIQTQQLDVNTILDMLEEKDDMQLDTIYLTGLDGESGGGGGNRQ